MNGIHGIHRYSSINSLILPKGVPFLRTTLETRVSRAWIEASPASRSVRLFFSIDYYLELGKPLESFLDEQFWIIHQFFYELK